MNKGSNDGWQIGVKPRRWQLDALDNWQDTNHGIVEVTTGGGKTVFAEMCMSLVNATNPDVIFLIVVPTIALMDQWHVSLQEDLHVDPDDIAIFAGHEKSERPKRVNLLILNTARKMAQQIALNRTSFLIVDECHRAASPHNSRALEGTHEFALGLSATPERQFDDGFERYLLPTLGPVIFRYDYPQALSDGVISQFELVNVEIELTGQEEELFTNLSQQIASQNRTEVPVETSGNNHGISSVRLESLLRKRASVVSMAQMRIPVAAAIAFRHRTDRMIIFHERISAAEEILSILAKKGFSAALYHSRMAGPLRRDNLRMFRRGMIDTLVTCRALDEGLNVPEATIAIIAASTSSRRQRIQRLGRVLRPSKGKPSAKIYTIYATNIEQKRLSNEALELHEAKSITWMSGKSHIE